MILSDILKSVDCYCCGSVNLQIESLFFDSRKTVKNGLFFCLQGVNTNGGKYAAQAIKNGAVAIVCTKKLNVSATQIVVGDVRCAMAIIAANFYGNPQQKLKIIGITGTSGKTSTSYIMQHILNFNSKKVGVIGTSGIFIGSKKLAATLTTPDSIELFDILSQMVANNIEYVIMEVSAHAIYYNKVFGINFIAKVLTNVKSDHLDFFKNDTQYQKTKLDFFKTGRNFVVFGDDAVGYQIKQNHTNKTVSFGHNKYNDFLLRDASLSLLKTSFNLVSATEILKISSRLVGEFNIYNMCAAICTLRLIDCTLKIEAAIKTLKNLTGRMQSINHGQPFSVIVDYAHTLDSLKNFLNTVKSLSGNKNIIVFGCPGERDSYKRFAMGKLAAEVCDVVVLTADNPASENARRIMWEMQQGAKQHKTKCYFIENRKAAIKKALLLADSSTNVLVVGKGCEDYQIVGDKKLPYSDILTIQNLLQSMGYNKN